MIALLIISGVLVYAFIGGVVYHVWNTKARKRCGRCSEAYHYCDHTFLAGCEALFWPIMLPVTGFGYCMYVVGKVVSDKIQSIVEEKV